MITLIIARALREIADTLDQRRPAPLLDDWFEQLLESVWRHVRPASRERRIADYRCRIRPELGQLRLDQLTVPVVRGWLDRCLERDGNRRCVQAAHETLCTMLAIALDHELVRNNHARRVRYPSGGLQTREPCAVDAAEYARLLDACRDVTERSLLRVLCEAGLRRSEAIELRIGDLHLDDGLIHVQRRAYRCADDSIDIDTPKNHKTRFVAISATLSGELREVIGGREHGASAHVWSRCNRYTGHEPAPLTGAAAYKLVKRIARHAGLDVLEDGRSISPHVMRATGASLAVAAGVPDHIAARQLGHARVDTTRKHYLRLPVIEPLRRIGEVFE
ncbi:MAG: site-specific integrase [Thermoleophilia bacterium]|nr:site-specific integrase [Thermoleophilia bacterium]